MAIGNPITLTNNVASKIISATATADQTLFTVTGGYRINQIAVFRNGVRLASGSDFTANDGASVTLITPANLNDILEFQIFDDFRVADAITSTGGNVSGNITATGTITGGSFSGDGSGLTGVASTDNIITGTAATFTGGINAAQSDVSVRNLTGVAATFTGVLTYEDVTNVDSVGIITARQGIEIQGGVGATFTDSVKAFFGTDGDLEIYHNGSTTNYIDSKATQLRIETDAIRLRTDSGETYLEGDANASVKIYYDNGLKFETISTGATVTGDMYATTFYGDGSNLSGVSAGGITTTQYSPSANAIIQIGLGTAQHHELTLSAGFTTITTSGGSMGDSHSLVLIQPSSGIATVGFSTYFLFPSGATPSMSEGGSKVDLVSFVVKTPGSSGVATALLASAGLNYQ